MNNFLFRIGSFVIVTFVENSSLRVIFLSSIPLSMSDNEIERKSEPWNVAKAYTHELILNLIIDINNTISITEHGALTIQEISMMPQHLLTNFRLQGLHSLSGKFDSVIENAYFACKKESKVELDALKFEVSRIRSKLSPSSKTTYDARVQQSLVQIQEPHFRVCLNAYRKIKTQLLSVLHDNKLIFPGSEQTDFHSLKNMFSDGG